MDLGIQNRFLQLIGVLRILVVISIVIKTKNNEKNSSDSCAMPIIHLQLPVCPGRIWSDGWDKFQLSKNKCIEYRRKPIE